MPKNDLKKHREWLAEFEGEDELIDKRILKAGAKKGVEKVLSVIQKRLRRNLMQIERDNTNKNFRRIACLRANYEACNNWDNPINATVEQIRKYLIEGRNNAHRVDIYRNFFTFIMLLEYQYVGRYGDVSRFLLNNREELKNWIHGKSDNVVNVDKLLSCYGEVTKNGIKDNGDSYEKIKELNNFQKITQIGRNVKSEFVRRYEENTNVRENINNDKFKESASTATTTSHH